MHERYIKPSTRCDGRNSVDFGVKPWLQTLAPPVTHTTTCVTMGSVSKLLSLICKMGTITPPHEAVITVMILFY